MLINAHQKSREGFVKKNQALTNAFEIRKEESHQPGSSMTAITLASVLNSRKLDFSLFMIWDTFDVYGLSSVNREYHSAGEKEDLTSATKLSSLHIAALARGMAPSESYIVSNSYLWS